MSSVDAKVRKPVTHAFVASALHTLGTEREGLAALAAAISDALGADFVAAVDTIRRARGRVIVTGMGKSGHIAQKSRRRWPQPERRLFLCIAAEASHGDLGMITADDVMLRCPGPARPKS